MEWAEFHLSRVIKIIPHQVAASLPLSSWIWLLCLWWYSDIVQLLMSHVSSDHLIYLLPFELFKVREPSTPRTKVSRVPFEQSNQNNPLWPTQKSEKPLKIRSFWHQRISGSSFRSRDMARNPKIQFFFGKSDKPLKIRSFWHQRFSGSSFRSREIAIRIFCDEEEEEDRGGMGRSSSWMIFYISQIYLM